MNKKIKFMPGLVILTLFAAQTAFAGRKCESTFKAETLLDLNSVTSQDYAAARTELADVRYKLNELEHDLKAASAQVTTFEGQVRRRDEQAKAPISKDAPVERDDSGGNWMFSNILFPGEKRRREEPEVFPENLDELLAHRRRLVVTLTNRIATAETEKTRLEGIVQSGETAYKAALIRYVNSRIREDANVRKYATDFLNSESLKALSTSKTVTVLVGAAGSQPTQQDQEWARRSVAVLKSRGYTILVDAHSPLAAEMVAQGNGQVLAIGTKAVRDIPAEQTFVISNPYLRAEIFAASYKSISTSTSPLGIAIALESKLDAMSGTSRGQWDGLDLWRWNMIKRRSNLGVPFYTKLEIYDSINRLVQAENRFSLRFPQESKDTIVRMTVAGLHLRELDELVQYVNRMHNGVNASSGPEAVIFGSSQTDRSSAPFIYETAYHLARHSIGTATGGAGGAMEAANMGAFDAGGTSLGIPMGGGGSVILENEKITPTSVQTNTVYASGYEERIPWLLNNRQLVIFAPGGSGTIRELAVTLFEFAQNPTKKGSIIFLQSSYYSELVEILKSELNLPEKLVSRIAVVDSIEELDKEIQNQRNLGNIDITPTATRARPRSTRKEFPAEKKWSGKGGGSKKKWDFDRDFDD